MTVTRPANLDARPIHVMHADLKRASEESAYRSICPKCETGILFVSRNQKTFNLVRYDRCIACAQTVIYEDRGVGGEDFEPLPPDFMEKLQAAMN